MGLIVDALVARPDQSREALGQHLGESGVRVGRGQLGLLLGCAELEQLVCSGRPLEGVHTYAPYADRVKETRRLGRGEALAELAVRYFTGHGPATERDLAYWATLSLGDVRHGLHEARLSLATFEVDGRTYWHAADSTPPSGAAEPAGHLLQILDETYRGYQESRMVIDADGIVPGGRETAIGMALVDGQIVAGMRRTVNRRVRFDLAPYRRLRPAELDALERAATRYGRFLGLDHDVTVAQSHRASAHRTV